ncbi:MAG: hypothetical protein QOJ03_3455, partial [Frankiaceae bacterium]|nr:hypothetical protein [Frankiaceae bacterium]
RTERVLVRPLTPSGHLRAGYHVVHKYVGTHCLSASIATGNAYRCFAGNNEIFDPCWVQNTRSPYVVCMRNPWTHRVVQLHVTKGFDDSFGGGAHTSPWAVTLTGGMRCVGVQGAAGDVDGYGISFGCNDGKTVLLEQPNTGSALWTIRAARDVGNYHYKRVAGKTIAKAYFGRPSLSSGS